MKLNLYLCFYENEEWCCYVVAKSRGRAKSIFQEYWRSDNLGNYIDIQAWKLKKVEVTQERLFDSNCKELNELGVKFAEEV